MAANGQKHSRPARNHKLICCLFLAKDCRKDLVKEIFNDLVAMGFHVRKRTLKGQHVPLILMLDKGLPPENILQLMQVVATRNKDWYSKIQVSFIQDAHELLKLVDSLLAGTQLNGDLELRRFRTPWVKRTTIYRKNEETGETMVATMEEKTTDLTSDNWETLDRAILDTFLAE